MKSGRKRRTKWITLDEALAATMAAKGLSEREAQEQLLQLLASGELTAYVRAQRDEAVH